jgi:hypothetical protein
MKNNKYYFEARNKNKFEFSTFEESNDSAAIERVKSNNKDIKVLFLQKIYPQTITLIDNEEGKNNEKI